MPRSQRVFKKRKSVGQSKVSDNTVRSDSHETLVVSEPTCSSKIKLKYNIKKYKSFEAKKQIGKCRQQKESWRKTGKKLTKK